MGIRSGFVLPQCGGAFKEKKEQKQNFFEILGVAV